MAGGLGVQYWSLLATRHTHKNASFIQEKMLSTKRNLLELLLCYLGNSRGGDKGGIDTRSLTVNNKQ